MSGRFLLKNPYGLGGKGFFPAQRRIVPIVPPGLTITGFTFHTGTFTLTLSPVPFLIHGQTLNSITERSSTGNMSISIAGALMQTFFTSVTFSNNIFGQLLYTTASADTFQVLAGNSIWTWNAQVFNAGAVSGTAAFV
jgi:hypothetical protein